MGYYTTFHGTLEITPPLQPHHKAYLERWFEMPHYRHDETALAKIPDPQREAVGLPVGPQGAFSVVVNQPDDHWTRDGISIEPPKVGARAGLRMKDGPKTPDGMPNQSTWCPWNVVDDEPNATTLQIGEGSGDSRKAYGFQDWLVYCLDKFFVPWGYKVNGAVQWEGEEREDIGEIVAKDNHVTFYDGKIVYEPHSSWGPDEVTNEEA